MYELSTSPPNKKTDDDDRQQTAFGSGELIKLHEAKTRNAKH